MSNKTGYRLDPRVITDLRKAQKTLNAQVPAIQALDECGYDCQQMNQAVQDLQARITALLTHFGGSGQIMEMNDATHTDGQSQ